MAKIKYVGSLLLVASVSMVAGCTSKISAPPIAKEASLSELERATLAVKSAPKFENYIQLGMAQLNAKDNESAAKSFEKATHLSPGSSIAWNDLCVAYNGMQHWEKAIEACKKAAGIDPAMVLAKNNLAFATQMLKRSSDVIASLEAKAQSTHNDANVILELGMQHYVRGEYQQAITTWRKIGRSAKIWPTAQNNIGSAAILSREFSVAKQAIDDALAAEPSNVLFKNNQRWLLQAQKDSGENAQ